MITLKISIYNHSDLYKIYDGLEVRKCTVSGIVPILPVDLVHFSTFSGIDLYNNKFNTNYLDINSNDKVYYIVDINGDEYSWYISRYVNTTVSSYSGWSDPVKGVEPNIFFNPLYPDEIVLGREELEIVNSLRRLTGDIKDIYHEVGEYRLEGIQSDNKSYLLDNKGWPLSINMFGKQYNSLYNPIVNNYKYLRFNNYLFNDSVTISGISYNVDIWYYTFNRSDKEYIDAYNNFINTYNLPEKSITVELKIVQTAYELLFSELWKDSTEDGASISDNTDSYNPSTGLSIRSKLLDDLKSRLDDLIKKARLCKITGVLID